MNNLIKSTCLAIACAAATPVMADDQWMATIGYASGGDKIGTIILEDHNGRRSTESIDAGSGASIAVGRQFNIDANYSIAATIGYKTDSVQASNGDLEMSRMPLDVLGIYKVDSHHFGLGISYELNPELDLSFLGSVDIDNALGLVAQYEYRTQSNIGIGVRYTAIDYEASDFKAKSNGNNLAVNLSLYF